MNNKFQHVAIVILKQTLALAFPDDPIKPPTSLAAMAGHSMSRMTTKVVVM